MKLSELKAREQKVDQILRAREQRQMILTSDFASPRLIIVFSAIFLIPVLMIILCLMSYLYYGVVG